VALDRACSAAAEAGARPYDDAFALIADPGVDAVVIASHDSVHAEQVIAAVRAGKPVLFMRCEVVGETGTVSLTEPARVVVDAERTRSIGYAADWRPRFADAYRLELQAWVDGVAAGRPTSLATAHDGVLAGAVADAVITSMRESGRVVEVAAI